MGITISNYCIKSPPKKKIIKKTNYKKTNYKEKSKKQKEQLKNYWRFKPLEPLINI